MRRKRRNYLPGFKARVTLAELAEWFDVQQNQVSEQKRLLVRVDTVFVGSTQAHKAADAAQLKKLHTKMDEPALGNNF